MNTITGKENKICLYFIVSICTTQIMLCLVHCDFPSQHSYLVDTHLTNDHFTIYHKIQNIFLLANAKIRLSSRMLLKNVSASKIDFKVSPALNKRSQDRGGHFHPNTQTLDQPSTVNSLNVTFCKVLSIQKCIFNYSSHSENSNSEI